MWLSPLVELRPVFDLRCGRFTLLEKLRRRYPREEFALWVRDELAEMTAECHRDTMQGRARITVNQPLRHGGLVISARVVLDAPVAVSGPEAVLLAGDEVVGFRLKPGSATGLDRSRGLDAALVEEQVRARVVRYPWDLVELNRQELEQECIGRSRGRVPGGATVVGSRQHLFIVPGARVWPGVIISTRTGPVFIDRGAEVRPGSFVEGPCYVGQGTVIDGALVRPGCSFGPECRIGGEVEATVFQGYANKRHEGFVGHSFVGEWVNLGALTTTSDLKNTYETVKVFYPTGAVDTGLAKVGCFFGDHVKTAIGSLFNSGCRIGPFANWFEPGLARKEVPAFSWGRHGRWSSDAAVANARMVMSRRGVQMSPACEKAVRSLFELMSGPSRPA